MPRHWWQSALLGGAWGGFVTTLGVVVPIAPPAVWLIWVAGIVFAFGVAATITTPQPAKPEFSPDRWYLAGQVQLRDGDHLEFSQYLYDGTTQERFRYAIFRKEGRTTYLQRGAENYRDATWAAIPFKIRYRP